VQKPIWDPANRAGSITLLARFFESREGNNCAAIMHRAKSVSASAEPLGLLTERQQQVATLVCDGLSSRAVAEKLGVTEGKVKLHLHAIYQKIGVHSRTALMIALADRSKSRSG
jgi:DNA-binding NarL/FixJ family response regulator